MADAIYVPKSDILDLITEEHEAGGFTDYSNYSDLWDTVDDMPAADVQPVAHAKWVCHEQEILPVVVLIMLLYLQEYSLQTLAE